MRIPTELLKKIKRIQISTAKKATDIFAGEYKSIFKGKGLEFVEVREYLPGDDVRAIDWNVTAKMKKPFIKKFIEERELTIMLLLDVSRSSCFGTVNRLKRDLAAEVCAILGAAAIKNNDKVGLITFSDRIETYLPPRKGTRHVFKVIREALCCDAAGRGTDIQGCLQYLDRVTKKHTITFLISDFYAANIKKSLAIASKRHDLVAVNILDPRDTDMPNAGIVSLNDAETGKQIFLDTSKETVRREYREKTIEKIKDREKMFYTLHIDRIDISTDKDYEQALIAFFKNRKMRRK